VVSRNVAAVDEQAAGGHIKKSRIKMHQSASCRRHSIHHRHHFSGSHFQIDVAQDFPRLIAISLVRKAKYSRSEMLPAKGGSGFAPGFSLTSSSVSMNLKISDDAPWPAENCY